MRVDPSFMNSGTGSGNVAKCSNIQQDNLFDKPALGSAAKLCISNCPQPLYCLMFLESDWHMIIGGWNDDYMDGLTSVELFNWRTGEQCLLTNGSQ